jgi:hypothetical protein
MFAATSPTCCLSMPSTELGGALDVKEMPSGALTVDRVAVAERELQVAALGHHPVPDADDLQLLL